MLTAFTLLTARNKKLKKTHLTSLKQLVAKQITDNEKIVLSGISPKYSIDNIDKGNFIIKEFQDDLAMNTARFKGYTPDARIVAVFIARSSWNSLIIKFPLSILSIEHFGLMPDKMIFSLSVICFATNCFRLVK